ncbi:hypothetical protein PanWU01x14_300500 [Parasponia andersonii]|uniref:Uncharacterized protein n=1 Tax=Parasponia andersonii TaxID=3476 RepID=A0A2P5AU02_PARAD|nr:hypothetical protein PanWU01x14_300500 [Parasponia andersonii]
MDEIICIGGESIKSIEIKVAENPKPKEPEKTNEKPKVPEKPKEKPKETEKPKPTPPASPSLDPCVTRWPPLAYPPFRTCCQECYEGRGGELCHYGHVRPPVPTPRYPPKSVPVPTLTSAPDPCMAKYPPLAYPPFRTCCQEC